MIHSPDAVKVHIKNMVCDRCRTAVANLLQSLKLHPINISLGEVSFSEKLRPEQLQAIKLALPALGFELIGSKKQQLIESIKQQLIHLAHLQVGVEKVTISSYLADKLHHDYSYLSNLFSSVEGVTIEQYLIRQKVERIKELMLYDEMVLSEIAYQMGYSSPAHMSSQFKKITGMAPSQFKKLNDSQQRVALDKV